MLYKRTQLSSIYEAAQNIKNSNIFLNKNVLDKIDRITILCRKSKTDRICQFVIHQYYVAKSSYL